MYTAETRPVGREEPVKLLIVDDDIGVRALRIGAQNYVVKGDIPSNLLTKAIRYAIERKKLETQLRQSQKIKGHRDPCSQHCPRVQQYPRSHPWVH